MVLSCRLCFAQRNLGQQDIASNANRHSASRLCQYLIPQSLRKLVGFALFAVIASFASFDAVRAAFRNADSADVDERLVDADALDNSTGGQD